MGMNILQDKLRDGKCRNKTGGRTDIQERNNEQQHQNQTDISAAEHSCRIHHRKFDGLQKSYLFLLPGLIQDEKHSADIQHGICRQQKQPQ